MYKWDEMTPTQRDCLVMEKVFGWMQTPTSCRCGASTAWMKPRPTGAWEMAGCICHHTPPVTADISAAWEVVEKMKSYEYEFSLFFLAGTRWESVFHGMVGRNNGHVAGTSAPDVICRSALRAVGVEIE